MHYQLLKQRGALNDAQRDADEIVAVWGQPGTSMARNRTPRAVNLTGVQIPQHALDLIPDSICWENHCIPYAMGPDGRTLIMATPDADNIALADKLTFVLNREVQLVSAPLPQIREALARYGKVEHQASVDSILHEFTETAIDFSAAEHIEDDEDELPRKRRSNAPSSLSGPWPGQSNRDWLSKASIVSPASARNTGTPHPPTQSRPRSGMFYYTIPEGTRVMMTRLDGSREILVGPRRVWRGYSEFHEISHHAAHPGDYLIVRFRDGHQEHVVGPAEVWYDTRIHDRIERGEGLQIASKEAIVVYSNASSSNGSSTPTTNATTTRRIVYGPDLFVPQPGEWLHTFSWHASKGGSKGVEKVPNGLVFQKLWLMPDQMYHDVHDVRTSDDAVLMIRLMIFFELVNIELMLDATHDPIGDFVNAATADVVEFTGRYDFEAFKKNTAQLNELATYKQLVSRAQQIGYHIHTVVYRGYGAANSLQLMHDQAIEARTKLQLDRATEQQAQELESFRLESQLARASKRRSEQADEVKHDLELNRVRAKTELEIKDSQLSFAREQRLADAKVRDSADRILAGQQQAHLSALRDMGVDLTSYLTQNRADQIFEFRGQTAPHVHVDPKPTSAKPANKDQE